MENLEKQEWYIGDFTLDCALGNKYEKSIENVICIPYTIKDDLCYFYNIETNEYIKLPIKLGNKYPFSTGLDKNSERIIDREYAIFMQDFIHIDLKKEIEIIKNIRKNKQDEWGKLKIIHDSWIPYSLLNRESILTKSEKEYNKFIYHKKNDSQNLNKKYIWKLVPFVINEKSSKKVFEKIMIPIAFSKSEYEFTYLEKWKKIELPTQEERSRLNVYYQEIKRFPAMLGLTNNIKDSKNISPEKALEWFLNTDLEKIKKKVETVEEIKKLNASYEEYKIINQIKEIFNNNDSIIDIINQINNIFKRYYLVTNLIKKCIKEEFEKNNKLELSPNQINLLTSISIHNLIDTVQDIKILDDNIAIIHYNDYYPSYVTNINSNKYYDTSDTYIELEYLKRNVPKNYTRQSYEEYKIYLEKMFNGFIKQLKINESLIIEDFCCNIIIQPVDLYIDKHIIDLYKAKREEEDISIDFIYIKPREYNEPIIKKGTITQYGKTDNFLIEEGNIEVLNIQREEKNKVKIKN